MELDAFMLNRLSVRNVDVIMVKLKDIIDAFLTPQTDERTFNTPAFISKVFLMLSNTQR